jgi:hypothetical protein
MARCEHPTRGETAIVQPDGTHAGEYVIQMGSDVAQGPIPMDKVAEAGQLSRENTGILARAYRLGDQPCDGCQGWWSEIAVRPARPGDDVADDLLSV